MRLSNLEKETGINFNEAESFAIVYTANDSLKKKLDMLCKSHPDNFQKQHFTGDKGAVKSYHIPKKYVLIRTPRVLSEKQKAALGKMHKRHMLTIARKASGAVK